MLRVLKMQTKIECTKASFEEKKLEILDNTTVILQCRKDIGLLEELKDLPVVEEALRRTLERLVDQEIATLRGVVRQAKQKNRALRDRLLAL